MLVPIAKIFLETKPGRVGFLSTSPPSSNDRSGKALYLPNSVLPYLQILDNFFSACPVHMFLMLQAHLNSPKNAGVSTKHKVEPRGKEAHVSNAD